MDVLSLTVVTPAGEVLREDGVTLLLAPSVDGQVGVLPNHASLMAQLQPGTLEVRQNGESQHLSVMDGFMEVMDNNVTEVRVLEVIPILETEIGGEKPTESSTPTFSLGQKYIPSQSNVHISEGEDIEECTEGSSSFVYSRQRTWETCSRSFIPEFSTYQNSIPETEQLIKHPNVETTPDGRSLPGRSINSRILDRCGRLVPILIIVCAFTSFIMAGFACKKIYDLSQETYTEDEGPKTQRYVLWGIALIVLLGTASILLVKSPLMSIIRPLRHFSIQESGNGQNYNRYEEI